MKKNKILFLFLLLPAGLAAMTRTALEAAPAPAAAFEIPEEAGEAALGLPDGFKVKVELALTRETQAKGLMFRNELAGDRGMLFVFKEGGEKEFWMKNTFVELDIIFLDRELKIAKVFHRVTPSKPGESDLEVSRVSAPAFCVLELAGGAARRHGLKPGAKLKISFPPGPAKRANPHTTPT